MRIPAAAWFEISGTDGPALHRFYGSLFDWQVEDSGGDSGYGLVQAGEKDVGGDIAPAHDGGPGQVTFYVEVNDPDAYLKRAEQLGGTTAFPPTEVPDFGITHDLLAGHEGHVIGLSKGAVR